MQVSTLKTSHLFKILAIMLGIVLTISIIEYVYLEKNNNDNNLNIGVPIKGSLKIWNGNKLIYNADDILTYMAYDYIICKVFNDSTACGQAGNGLTTGSLPYCKYYNTAGVIVASTFWAAERCSAAGIELGNPSVAPTLSPTLVCSSAINSNGITPIEATTSHTVSSGSITLTASWTPVTNPINGINEICLGAWSDIATTGFVQGGGTYQNVLAIQTFTAFNSAVGVPITIQWTFTFSNP